MNKNTLEKIMSELKNAIDKPICEFNVNPEAVKARALDMAKLGYRHTEASLTALEMYIKGFGLWLSGDVGTGKTMFFKLLRPLNLRFRTTGQIPKIIIFPMVRTLEMSVDDIKEWLGENFYNEVVLDDVGAEPVYNHFGGKFDILPYILDKRLDSPCRTHATSNLKPKAMVERYDDKRILDRFSEMFVKIPFTGPSMRHSQPNAVIRAAQTLATQKASECAVKVAATPQDAHRSNEKPPSCAPGGQNG